MKQATEIEGFYTSQELQQLLGVSKQRVANIAACYDWDKISAGVLYAANDVNQYLQARWRRELALEFGVTVNGLVTHDKWDKPGNCPACGGFAIWKPATEAEKDLGEVYQMGWPWKCINGHKL